MECAKEEVLLVKCICCIGQKHKAADETIILHEMPKTKNDRFSGVEKLEAMTPDERFAFWKSELSKCIRCNACRNVCPACSCVKCVFDNPNSGIAAQANDTEIEEQMFHIIRASHVTGRCNDCGEFSRVCPQNIPLHLLHRKLNKDIGTLDCEILAGDVPEGKTPLINYWKEDTDPGKVFDAKRKHV